ncbi:diguanylate cyclase [Pseudomonas sp. A2]|nr:diguanylate cyclase [Pseudomonas sp. A2]
MKAIWDPVGAGSPAKNPTRCMAPASPVFAGEPAPTEPLLNQ